ncbi:unnamed protein product [marine sediment metagenome]|uniref:Uncharacterized protein n=1 Tax=marine sediment metagenome TaxID=412755 RepID=X1BWV1_9ZZZZ
MSEVTPDEYAAMQGENEMPQEYVEFAKFVVEDNKIPKKVQDDYWGFFIHSSQ